GDQKASKIDRKQWQRWQDLYETIGGLTQLQKPSLQPAFSVLVTTVRPSPVLLRLGDHRNVSRPGHLSELKGLGQLRILRTFHHGFAREDGYVRIGEGKLVF
ncbi:hypothetical protein BGX29_011605, partial [Mortierella sp. GBA35]